MTRRRPRVFGDFDRSGRYWPNVGKCCVRCQRKVLAGDKSERFERKGGGVLTRHVGTCPNPERPYRERVRVLREMEEGAEARRRRIREAEEALRAAGERVTNAFNTVTWTPSTGTYPTSAGAAWIANNTTGRIRYQWRSSEVVH